MNEALTLTGLQAVRAEYERQKLNYERGIVQAEGCILAIQALIDHCYPPPTLAAMSVAQEA